MASEDVREQSVSLEQACAIALHMYTKTSASRAYTYTETLFSQVVRVDGLGKTNNIEQLRPGPRVQRYVSKDSCLEQRY